MFVNRLDWEESQHEEEVATVVESIVAPSAEDAAELAEYRNL